MDVETSEAIERVSDSVNTLRLELQQMGLVLNERIDNLDQSLNGRIDNLNQSLEAKIREGVTEAKRFAQILHEDLKDDIRIVAEGVAHLSAKFDARQ